MGSSNCHCNRQLCDSDLVLYSSRFKGKVREIRKLQQALRRFFFRKKMKRKLKDLRLTRMLMATNTMGVFSLKYNPSWERDFKKKDKNIYTFNLQKLGKTIEEAYGQIFDHFKSMDNEKKIVLRLIDESNFDSKFDDFIKNYKLIIYKYLSATFNLGKNKEYFDKLVLESESSPDISTISSNTTIRPSGLEFNNESILTKEKFKHSSTAYNIPTKHLKVDWMSNAETSVDCFSKINTQTKNSPQLMHDCSTPYYAHILHNLTKEAGTILEEREYGSTDFYYSGSFHRALNVKYGVGRKYVFVPHTDNCISKYYGYFIDNDYNGYGLLVTSDGIVYKGEFRDGRRSGYGIEKKSNYIYKGFFLEDIYTGYGEIYPIKKNKEFKDNKVVKPKYRGGFKNNKKEGFGFMQNEDGSRYIGYWKEDRMNGIGLFVWREGHKYFGMWKDDKMHGKGTYRWVNGDVFTGYYENDLKEGEGEYYFKARKSYLRGRWEQGKKQGLFLLLEGKELSRIEYINDQIVVD